MIYVYGPTSRHMFSSMFWTTNFASPWPAARHISKPNIVTIVSSKYLPWGDSPVVSHRWQPLFRIESHLSAIIPSHEPGRWIELNNGWRGSCSGPRKRSGGNDNLMDVWNIWTNVVVSGLAHDQNLVSSNRLNVTMQLLFFFLPQPSGWPARRRRTFTPISIAASSATRIFSSPRWVVHSSHRLRFYELGL
jgi:hypothetical protein